MYQLTTKETVSDGIKRVAQEELDRAIAQLSGQTEESHEEAIHDARKRLKKLRALLRLVRDRLGQDTYERENLCFRDAARKLSDLRDAQVYLETLDWLREEAADISQETLTELRTALEVQYQQVATQIVEETSGVTSAIEDMQVARQRVASWTTPDDWSPLKKGIKRVYKQGRKALKRSQEAPTLENRHEWRKQVKYLWYQVRLLHPLWSPMMDALSEEMEKLSDRLGSDRDLALLKQWLLEQWATEAETAAEELSGDRAALLAAIEQHQQRLQHKAERLGERIYAESPKQFVHRLKSYWQVWQQ